MYPNFAPVYGIYDLTTDSCIRTAPLCQTVFVVWGMVDLLVDDECVNIDSVKLTSALGSTLPDSPNTW